MKRILALAFALLCASALHGTRAAAQCGATCTPIVGADGKLAGWGCVEDPDSRTTCTATSRGCSLNDCGGLAVIRDTKGAVLASAELCGRKVREIRHVAVVPVSQPTAPLRLAALTGLPDRPQDLRAEPAGQ
jgi:hypothetical protein